MNWTVVARTQNGDLVETAKFPSRGIAAKSLLKYRKAYVFRNQDRCEYVVTLASK